MVPLHTSYGGEGISYEQEPSEEEFEEWAGPTQSEVENSILRSLPFCDLSVISATMKNKALTRKKMRKKTRKNNPNIV
jgi:hypothetical protein